MWQPGVKLEEVERIVILQALRFHQGNRTHTANSLGISIRTLAARISIYRDQGHSVTPPPAHGSIFQSKEKQSD